jgi:hypothetical protein
MDSALQLRAALDELVPAALYRLPPEDAPRGSERGVRVSQPVHGRDDARLSAVAPDAEPDEEASDVRELEEMFEFGPELDNEIPALGGTQGERIHQAVLKKGVDALGWYVPFHAIGVQWGIYIATSSLAYMATRVFSNVPVDVRTRVRLAFRAIHQHELFHFAMEYAVAQLELLFAEPIHVHRLRLRDPRLGYIVAEEQAANAWMLRSLWSAKRSLRPAGRARALRSFVAGQPAGYRDAGEIVRSEKFRAACRDLLVNHLLSVPYDPRGAERVNVDWLLPITPRIDWRQCPVHVLHDDTRLPFAPGAFDLFANVRGVVLTPAFEAGLKRLPASLQRAWDKTQRLLETTTASAGLDFKLWERKPSGRVYSVRVSRGCRAHLQYDEHGTWFAEEIGSHAEMGHG